MQFEWDKNKSDANLKKHGIDFTKAQRAFDDPNRRLTIDNKHSTNKEKRFFCFGKVDNEVMTVRFTVRDGKTRIFGAGYWRDGRKMYEER